MERSKVKKVKRVKNIVSKVVTLTMALTLTAGIMSNSAVHATSFTQGSMSPTSVNPNAQVPTLVVLMDFTNVQLKYSESDWYNEFFGNKNSVAEFYNRASNGKVTFVPVHTNNGTNGILKVNVNQPHPNSVPHASINASYWDKLRLDAVNQAIIKGDIAQQTIFDLDKNGDGFLEPTELSIVYIFAGGSSQYGDPLPNITSSSGPFSNPSTAKIGGKYIAKAIQVGETQAGNQTTMGVFTHELGHNLGLKDLYPNGDIGSYSLMSSGNQTFDARQPDGILGQSPTHMDPFSKIFLNLVQPTVVNYTENKIVRLYPEADGFLYNTVKVTTADPSQYFLLDTRQFQDYDKGLTMTQSSDRGGLEIFHIDESQVFLRTILDPNGNYYSRFEYNSINNNPNHPGVQLEKASNSKRLANGGKKNDYFFGADDAANRVFSDTLPTGGTNAQIYTGSGSSSDTEVPSYQNSGVKITALSNYIPYGSSAKPFDVKIGNPTPELHDLISNFGTITRDQNTYTLNVSNTVSSVSLLLDKYDGYSVTFDGVAYADGKVPSVNTSDASHTIVVTETATGMQSTFTLQINKVDMANNNVLLSSLTASVGNLNPVFDALTTFYKLDVPYTSDSMSFTPTAEDSTAVIKVNGTVVPSGQAYDIPLSVGDNSVSISLENSGATKQYNIVVNRHIPGTDNINIKKITGISNFDSSEPSCDFYVSHWVGENKYGVTPILEDSRATFTINGVTYNSGSLVMLPSKRGTVTTTNMTVTSSDGTKTANYALNLNHLKTEDTRTGVDNITFNKGTLSPSFSKDVFNYTLTGLNYSDTTVNVNTLVENLAAKVYINGSKFSGNAVNPITLKPGANTITVQGVTEDSGVLGQAYTITVDLPTAASTDNTLSSLSTSPVDITNFSPDTTSYTVNVPSNTTVAEINATASSPAAILRMNGTQVADKGTMTVPLNFGTTTYKINVTSESKAQKTYTINFVRSNEGLSTDNNLSRIHITDLSENPIDFGFSSDTTNYSQIIDYSIDKIIIGATPANENATVSINGEYSNATSEITTAIKPGSNKLQFIVTSESGAVKKYTVELIRYSPSLSTDATLSSLKIVDGNNFIPLNFDPNTTTYTITLPNNLTSWINFTPALSDSNALVSFMGEDMYPGSTTSPQYVKTGTNTYKFDVTAEDGVTKQTYTVIIVKPE